MSLSADVTSTVPRRPGGWLAWKALLLGIVLMPGVIVCGEALDAAGLERPFLQIHQLAFDFPCWAGVRDALGTIGEWRRWQTGGMG